MHAHNRSVISFNETSRSGRRTDRRNLRTGFRAPANPA